LRRKIPLFQPAPRENGRLERRKVRMRKKRPLIVLRREIIQREVFN